MAHIHDKIDFVVEAYIVHDEKVLLILHSRLKFWLAVGGHVELDEQTDQALFREVQEECGLDIKLIAPKVSVPTDPRHFMEPLNSPQYVNIVGYQGDHQHINMIYFATSESSQVTLAEDEHDNIRWFSREELSEPKYDVLADVQFYANEALDRAAEHRKTNLEKFKKTLQ